MYKLNKRFSVSHDKFQWVLVETFVPKEGTIYERNKYYSTLNQLSAAIIDAEAKKSLGSLPKDRVKEVDKVIAYGTMLEGLVKRLESYLESKGI
jgi:hypothetical protein